MKRGEIWLINLDPTVGAEIRKTRPAIVVNDDTIGRLPLKVIVPLTDWKEHYEIAPWMVKTEPDKKNNLEKTSSTGCFQVRFVSETRFVRKIGAVSEEILQDIGIALAVVLKI